MDKVYFLCSNFLVILISILCADIGFANRAPWRRTLVALSCYPIIILLTILILGSFGILNKFNCILFLSVIFIFLVFVRYQFCLGQSGVNNSVRDNIKYVFKRNNVLKVISLWVAGILTGLLIGGLLLKGTQFIYDDFCYHANVAAHWCLDGYLSLKPENVRCYYPFNAEILSLWFMLPFHNDTVVSLAGIFWSILLMSGAVCICLNFGASQITVLLSSILIIASPAVKTMARSFSAVDVAAPAMIIAAIAVVVPALDQRGNKEKCLDLVYGGLLAGFAIGTKVSFIIFGFVLLLWIFCDFSRISTFKTRILGAGGFMLGLLLTGSFWYVRNWYVTGNPIFPAQFGPFEGPFLTEQINRTRLINWIVNDPLSIRQWKFIIQRLVSWPTQLFVLCVIGYLGVGVGVWKKKFAADQRVIAVLLLATGLIMFASHFIMPFSGTDDSSDAKLRVELRFILPSYFVGGILFCLWLECVRKRYFWLGLAVCVVVIPLRVSNVGNCLWNGIAILVGLLVLCIWKRMVNHSRETTAFKYVWVGAIVMILTGFVCCFSYQKRYTNQNIFSNEAYSITIGDAWGFVETLHEGSIIAWLGTPQYYALFGRSLQLRPVQINYNGEKYLPWHVWWFEDPKNNVYWKQLEPDARFVNNIMKSNIEYMLIVKERNGDWPLGKKYLEESNKGRIIYDNGDSQVWEMQAVRQAEE